jgi:hypothetical protein
VKRHIPTAGLLAATLLATAAGAAGDVPGNVSTRATLRVTQETTQGSLETSPDSDWYRVQLRKGQDYTVRFIATDYSAPATATLRDPRQRPVGSTSYNVYGDLGFEHRATATGVYFLDVTGQHDPDYPGEARPYAVAVTFDCRDASTTKCTLEPGRPRDGNSTYVGDYDRFAANLEASRRYDFTVTAGDEHGYCFARVLDARGAVVAEAPANYDQTTAIRGFRPARTGKHYLSVGCEIAEDYGMAYRVSVTQLR